MARGFKAGEAPWEVNQPPTPTAPSQGFKAGSAPWEQQVPTEPTEKFSGAESGLQGVGSGISFGYLPQLQAITEVGLDKVLPESMGGGRGVTYQQAKDQWVGRDEAIATEDPGTYLAGNVGGSLLLPGMGAAKGVTTAGRVGRAVGTGAITGAAVNPGDVQGQSGDLQINERLKNAAVGAAGGGVFQGGGEMLGKAAAALKKGRESLALKLAGARKAHFLEIAKKKSGPELVEFMEKNGMTKPGQSYETVLAKSTKITEDVGPKIGETYKSVAGDLAAVAQKNPQAAAELNKTRLNARRITAEILRDARKELRGKAGGREALGKLRNELENLKDLDRTKIRDQFEMDGFVKPQGVSGLPVPSVNLPVKPGGLPPPATSVEGDVIDMVRQRRVTQETPFEKLLTYRQSLDDVINYNKTFGESKTNEKAFKIARTSVDRILDKRINTIDKFVGGKRVEKLKGLKKQYSQAKTLQRMSMDRVAGEDAKANIGLLETIAGTGYAASEIAQGKDPVTSITKGLVGGLALRQGRKYGPGLGYQTVKGAEKLVGKTGGLARLPQQAYITPWVRMNREEEDGNK